MGLVSAAGTGLHRPVMPGPVGTSRFQTAYLRTKRHSFRIDRNGGWRKSGGSCFDGDFARALRRLNNCHAETGEGLSRGAFVGFVIGGVAVSDADQFPFAGDPEGHFVIGDGQRCGPVRPERRRRTWRHPRHRQRPPGGLPSTLTLPPGRWSPAWPSSPA